MGAIERSIHSDISFTEFNSLLDNNHVQTALTALKLADKQSPEWHAL